MMISSYKKKFKTENFHKLIAIELDDIKPDEKHLK